MEAILVKKHTSRQYLASSFQPLWLNKQGYLWTEWNNDLQAAAMPRFRFDVMCSVGVRTQDQFKHLLNPSH